MKKGDTVKIQDHYLPMSRWTFDRGIAHDFAKDRTKKGQKAYVLSATIPADKILMMDGFTGLYSYSGELESVVLNKDLEAKIEEEYIPE